MILIDNRGEVSSCSSAVICRVRNTGRLVLTETPVPRTGVGGILCLQLGRLMGDPKSGDWPRPGCQDRAGSESAW